MENDQELTEIESFCPNCELSGITRLLVVKIPYFKDVVVSSFECQHCGNTNREVQTCEGLNEKGGKVLKLIVQNEKDLNRQIVVTEHASLKIEELDLECPPDHRRTRLVTLEGLLSHIAEDLRERFEDINYGHKLVCIVDKVNNYISGKQLPFTFVVNDPSGNSYIEPICSDKDDEDDTNNQFLKTDKQLIETWYTRADEQIESMGYLTQNNNVVTTDNAPISDVTQKSKHPPSDITGASVSSAIQIDETHAPQLLSLLDNWNLNQPIEENVNKHYASDTDDDQMSFPVNCCNCSALGSNLMCRVNIPGFKECLIMTFTCKECGAKCSELKPMGAYGEFGKRWILKVDSVYDINRDILKSDTASIEIPEIELIMCCGTLGGIYTTIEGLLSKVEDELRSANQFYIGDSANPNKKKRKFDTFLTKLHNLTTKPDETSFTLILDDPADLSMIGKRSNCFADKDLNLKTETYNRTEEQNDDLGIIDMKVENY